MMEDDLFFTVWRYGLAFFEWISSRDRDTLDYFLDRTAGLDG